MTSLRAGRARLFLTWLLFGAVALATAFAVHGLYALVRGEIAAQERAARERELERLRARSGAFADDVRRATIAELAGFHADGLTRALRRWDESNTVVVATFEWDAARGLVASSPQPEAAPDPAALESLWQAFAAWRREHPDRTACDLSTVGDWRTVHLRTLDQPAFASQDLGYQAENLDVLAYAGRRVDPWAGWAASRDDARAPWVFWYRAGPDEPVRGCLVGVEPLIAEIRAAFADPRLARIEIGPTRAIASSSPAEPLGDFPAHAVVVGSGSVYLEKAGRVQLSAVAVALLFGMFVLGAAFLVVYSRREAREAERKTTFVSQVSHELRTPLTSIRMFADMLAAPAVPEDKRRKFAGTIARESQRLAALIERLLTFNALEKGKVAAAVGTVDVAAVARETLDEMEAALRDGGLQVEKALPSGPVLASTDASAVKQALINLLDNALKYAREGGSVRVALDDSNGLVRLRVADRGPGIAAGLRARVFEPFVQGGDRALTSKPAGLGLGLGIARGLLRGAGGDLVLVEADHGATFEIRLPRPTPT